jgi:hypothetical protein
MQFFDIKNIVIILTFYPIDYEALVFHPKNIATIMINFLNGRKIMTYEVTSDEPWFIFSCQVIFF